MVDKMSFEKKIEHAKDVLRAAVAEHERVSVACSFGKDSLVVVHMARQVDPNIPIFAVLTQYKPKETFEYLVKMYFELRLEPFTVYMVAREVPSILVDAGIRVVLLSVEDFEKLSFISAQKSGKALYVTDPDMCCELLKVRPTMAALKDVDAWICGLRNTEGRTRKDYKEVEEKGGLIKINPILKFTEKDVYRYLKAARIPLHPWYSKILPDGRRYRSLGCEVCTVPILPNQLEREGRWINTSKCGGECGIHTKMLK